MSAARTAPIEIGDIAAMLVGRVESLCAELFPNGVKQGGEYRVGSLAGETGQSLAIRLRDGHRPAGTWKDFAGGAVQGRDRGDLLWLIACALFGGDLGKAVAWAKSWLHLDDLDPGRLAQFRLEAKAASEAAAAAAAKAIERTRASAVRRWHMGVPINGTIAETYLASRGVDFRRLGKTPRALRFNDKVQYGYGEGALLLPAMVAQVNALDGAHIATHRTWLKPDGSDKAGAAEGLAGKPKKVLGQYLGGHIAIWKGEAGTMPLRDVPAGTDVYVTEGIEDACNAACAAPELRVVAGISVGNFAELALPPQIGRLVFLKQNDPPGSDADQGFWRAVAAQRARGFQVWVAPPPAEVKDVTELAERMRVAA
ncbi:MAG: hypothetical protein QOH04_2596 [Sphingomonadales bacterium]|nr:hypothetical protein [Sphingomonadales bacterium]